ncbi:MAG: hypothetical protein M3O02_07225 [Acidobacteriota bacterium]|nr:hypothetical protein [Acidobacteriota bacterium]
MPASAVSSQTPSAPLPRSAAGWFRLGACALLALSLLTGATHTALAQTLLVLRPVPPSTKKDKKKKSAGLVTTPLQKSDLGEIKLGGKPVEVSGLTPLLGGDFGLQFLVLIDSMEQIGINEQFDDMRKLFDHLPKNVEIGVGYMLQGKVRLTQDFTTDRKLAGDALKVPQETTLPKNDNGGPYNCLKYLANHWPNPDPKKLRAVLMITDGVNRYNSFQGGDQDDPDVVSSAALLVRAGIMPFPFFYMDPVTPQGRSEGGQMEGQTNFDLLASSTQGAAIYQGMYSPATFDPLLQRLFSILNSMSVATLNTSGSGFKQVDVKASREDIGINAPDGVTLGNVLKSSK